MPSLHPTAFDTLALAPSTLDNLKRLGYLEMTAIQAASLPPALLGKDLIAQAKTGSGKTAAFALALLANLNARRFAVQALVLCPTRELADQVTTEIRRLARAEDRVRDRLARDLGRRVDAGLQLELRVVPRRPHLGRAGGVVELAGDLDVEMSHAQLDAGAREVVVRPEVL